MTGGASGSPAGTKGADVETAAVPREEIAAIAAGGALGALGRWLLGSLTPGAATGLAWGTLLVNVSGAFALGLLLAWIETRREAPPLLRPFAAVGLLGGWTTYSALALDARTMLADGRAGQALVYLGLTAALGVAAATAGLVLGQRHSEQTGSHAVTDEGTDGAPDRVTDEGGEPS